MSVVTDTENSPLKVLLHPLKDQKKRLCLAFFSLLVMSGSQVLILFLIGPLLKVMFLGDVQSSIGIFELLPKGLHSFVGEQWNITVDRQKLVFWVPAMVLSLGLLRSIANYLYQVCQAGIALYIASEYRTKVFSKLIHSSFEYLKSKSAAQWMSVIMNDILYLQMRFSEILTTILRDSFLIISCFVALSIIHYQTALALLVALPFVAVVLGAISKKISLYSEMWQRNLALIAAKVLDLRSRFFFIRAQGAESFEEAEFDQLNDGYYQSIRKSIFIRSVFAPGLEWVGFAVFALFIFLVGKKQWGADFGPEVMIQFFAALGLLLRPLKNFGEQLSRASELRGSLEKSAEILKLKDASTRAVIAETAKRPETKIELENLRVEYSGKEAINIANVSLDFGMTVAIVGPSGAGKSTFVKALAGLISASTWQGSISQADIMNMVSMVSQYPFLFEGSLRENLNYGQQQDFSDARLAEVLALVNLSADVGGPEGLDMNFNPLTPQLSGGQIQRLVIARALLRNAPIWIFDEATSSVDVQTEKDILERTIAACHEQKSLFLAVSHRLQFLSLFDRVLYCESGQIHCQGRHSDLMESNERYREFCLEG